MYSGVPRVNRGETGKMMVDTPDSGMDAPESWHTVCLIFARVSIQQTLSLFLGQ